MPAVGATLTWAIPVKAELLAVKIETRIQSLPTVTMLRLCNRFGTGRFSDFPVEIVEMIEGYFITSVQEDLTKRWTDSSALRCFQNKCSYFDHIDRTTLLRIHHQRTELHLDVCSCEWADKPSCPDDNAFLACRDSDRHDLRKAGIIEEQEHYKNRKLWWQQVQTVFSEETKYMFFRSFGLDIWHSASLRFRRTDHNTREGSPYATTAYLTLSDSKLCTKIWDHDQRQGRDVSVDTNGMSMFVEVGKPPSKKELAKFPMALKVLGLDLVVPVVQERYHLRLGSPKTAVEDNSDPDAHYSDGYCTDTKGTDGLNVITPQPRLTLLIAHDDSF